MKTTLALAAIGLGLAACAPAPESFPGLGTDTGSCNASGYYHLLGQPKEAIKAMTLPSPTRLLGPGMGATMDFNPSRLNLYYNNSGRISKVYCG